MTGTGTDIEQRTNRPGPEFRQQNAVDIRRQRRLLGRERCQPAPLGDNGCQAPSIPQQYIVILVHQLQDLADDRTAGAGRWSAVIDPVLLAEAIEQPGFAENFQMARNSRLTLADDLADFPDRQFTPRKQRQQPQPGRFGGGAERGNGWQEWGGHESKHISKYLYGPKDRARGRS